MCVCVCLHVPVYKFGDSGFANCTYMYSKHFKSYLHVEPTNVGSNERILYLMIIEKDM